MGQSMVTNPQVIFKLKSEAATNPVFNAVAHTFAMRERSRRVLSLNTLVASMNSEGFNFTREQVREVMQFLADNKVGKLWKGPRGGIRGLKDIQFNLPSVGRAALSQPIITSSSPKIKLRKNKDKIAEINQKINDGGLLKIEFRGMKLEVDSFPEGKVKELFGEIEKLK